MGDNSSSRTYSCIEVNGEQFVDCYLTKAEECSLIRTSSLSPFLLAKESLWKSPCYHILGKAIVEGLGIQIAELDEGLGLPEGLKGNWN